MSLLQNEDNIKSKNNTKEKSVYELPAVVRQDKENISIEKALVVSLLLHPAVVVLILLASLILRFLGIDFDLFKKPDLVPKDIEFVLVDKEGTPIDKNTKNRADKNSRAGGINDPTRKVSLPQPAAPKPDNKPAVAPKAPEKKQAAPQKAQQPKTAAPQTTKPVQKAEQPAPKAPAPKPTPAAPAAPKVTQKPTSSFTIPVPKSSSIPQVAQPTAPVTAAPKIGGGSPTGVSGGTGSAPAPTFSQSKSTSGGGSGGGSSNGRFSGASGSGSGSGNVGNPGPGNPKGAPGIDAIKEPDFGPYMKELQRRIKMNWDPPKGNESKRVILLFTISKDGRLMSVKVHKSSGLQAADNAAINAVKLTAPFRPLPAEFRGSSVDIQFTFDYNVLGAKMY